jgi:uncharacterized protein YjbI with pentapeptide repeats
MASKNLSQAAWTKRLAGKSIAFATSLPDPKWYGELASSAGAKVAKAVAAGVDYLVVDGPKAVEKKQAEKLNEKGTRIPILLPTDFFNLLAPTLDEIKELCEAGLEGEYLWRGMKNTGVPMPDLTGADFHGIKFDRHVDFGVPELVGVDLHDADLGFAVLPALREVNLQGVNLRGGMLKKMTDCRAAKVVLTWAYVNPSQLVRVDFADAVMQSLHGQGSQITDCSFKGADLQDAELEQAQFSGVDFTGANLTGARLLGCKFAGGTLARANLAGADLSITDLRDADLRGADLRGACLFHADLTGATIDGANFEGASLFGTTMAGIDPAKATGLDPDKPHGRGHAGPNLEQLSRLARDSKRLDVTAVFDLSEENVSVAVRCSKQVVDVSHAIFGRPTGAVSGFGPANRSFADGLLYLTNRFLTAKLRPDSVVIKSDKVPIPGKELKKIVFAAVEEAFGLNPLDEEERKESDKAKKKAETDPRQPKPKKK